MPVSYQLHSANDLREWNAWFAKGGRALKIDPHCVSGSSSFILSHDDPDSNDTQLKYSTLEDVLQYFRNNGNRLSGKDIEVALCFKGRPKGICNEEKTDDAIQWLQQVDSFFTEADNVVELVKNNNDVTLSFVLDGDAKPCDCLSSKFLPWKSVWIDRDTCSVQCMTSNEGYCNRFAMLNNPDTSDWQSIAAPDIHYGKFGLDIHTPLRVWEPDFEETICDLITTYELSREGGVPSGSELSFAINLDPAMFDVFSSGCLVGTEARGFNVVVGGDEEGQRNGNGESEPELVTLGNGKFVLRYLNKGNTATTTEAERNVEIPHGTFEELTIGPEQDTEQNPIRISSDDDSPFLLNEEGCPLRWKSSGMCIWRIKNDTLRKTFSGTLLAASLQVVDDHTFVFCTDGSRVYGGYHSHHPDEEGQEGQPPPIITTNFRLLGYGRAIDTSSLSGQILLVTEGNHCYNSHVHNTQTKPLVCDVPKDEPTIGGNAMLDYTFGSTDEWIKWLTQPPIMDNKSSHLDTVLTSCNDKLLHGTFTAGSNPSSSLFELKDGTNRMGVLVAAESYVGENETLCGTPRLGVNGIVISGFGLSVLGRNDGRDDVQGTSSTAKGHTFMMVTAVGIAIVLTLLVLTLQRVRVSRRQRKEYNVVDS